MLILLFFLIALAEAANLGRGRQLKSLCHPDRRGSEGVKTWTVHKMTFLVQNADSSDFVKLPKTAN